MRNIQSTLAGKHPEDIRGVNAPQYFSLGGGNLVSLMIPNGPGVLGAAKRTPRSVLKRVKQTDGAVKAVGAGHNFTALGKRFSVRRDGASIPESGGDEMPR
jgi:hypothetical protein